MEQYHAVQRTKGKKWQTVATLNVVPKSCKASAQRIFEHLDVDLYWVQWDNVMQQKNWSGFADDCLNVVMSQDEQKDLLENLHIKRMKQIKDDMEHYLYINQDDPVFCAKIKARWND